MNLLTRRKIFFLMVLVFLLTAPFQIYHDSVEELPAWAGIALGLFAAYLGVIYDKKHPDLINSLSYWDIPKHSIKALFLMN